MSETMASYTTKMQALLETADANGAALFAAIQNAMIDYAELRILRDLDLIYTVVQPVVQRFYPAVVGVRTLTTASGGFRGGADAVRRTGGPWLAQDTDGARQAVPATGRRGALRRPSDGPSRQREMADAGRGRSSEAFEHDLALGAATLDQRMGPS
jgi:hypothetical protein